MKHLLKAARYITATCSVTTTQVQMKLNPKESRTLKFPVPHPFLDLFHFTNIFKRLWQSSRPLPQNQSIHECWDSPLLLLRQIFVVWYLYASFSSLHLTPPNVNSQSQSSPVTNPSHPKAFKALFAPCVSIKVIHHRSVLFTSTWQS